LQNDNLHDATSLEPLRYVFIDPFLSWLFNCLWSTIHPTRSLVLYRCIVTFHYIKYNLFIIFRYMYTFYIYYPKLFLPLLWWFAWHQPFSGHVLVSFVHQAKLINAAYNLSKENDEDVAIMSDNKHQSS